MNTVRAGQPGATRVCPHCKATVLESAAICPGCRHHLRFSNGTQLAAGAGEGYCTFSIDGTIAHKVAAEPCEYCIVLDIRNERGEQLLRQIVGVGALQAGELRRLNVSVEMLPLVRQSAPRPSTTPLSASREPTAPLTAAARTSGMPRAPGAAQPASPTPSASAASAAASPAPTPSATAAAQLNPPRPAPAPLHSPGGSRSAATGKGAAPRPGAPGAPAAASAPPKPAEPNASGALAQRLRIFRKP